MRFVLLAAVLTLLPLLLLYSGRFSPFVPGLMTGAVSCTPCRLGTAQAAPGQQSCDACRFGSFANVTGSVGCSVCPRGTYSRNETGASACTLCAQGTAGTAEGQADCSKCHQVRIVCVGCKYLPLLLLRRSQSSVRCT